MTSYFGQGSAYKPVYILILIYIVNIHLFLFCFEKLVIHFNPLQTGGGGGGLLRTYKSLKLNNFKTVKAMTTKFRDFS